MFSGYSESFSEIAFLTTKSSNAYQKLGESGKNQSTSLKFSLFEWLTEFGQSKHSLEIEFFKRLMFYFCYKDSFSNPCPCFEILNFVSILGLPPTPCGKRDSNLPGVISEPKSCEASPGILWLEEGTKLWPGDNFSIISQVLLEIDNFEKPTRITRCIN